MSRLKLIEKQNNIKKRYTMQMLVAMLDNVENQGIVDTGKTYRTLRVKQSYHYSEIDRSGFKMLRSAIMVEKGAGRGWRNPSSTRQARPWFGPALDRYFSQMADELGKVGADEMAKQIDFQDKPVSQRGMNNYRIEL